MFQFVSSIVAAMEFARVIFSGILVSLLLSVGAAAKVKDLPPCNFKAIYNFGDSNSDTGAISAAIFPRQWPNGETFFRKPAGRVCDGRLMIDFIGNKKMKTCSPSLSNMDLRLWSFKVHKHYFSVCS